MPHSTGWEWRGGVGGKGVNHQEREHSNLSLRGRVEILLKTLKTIIKLILWFSNFKLEKSFYKKNILNIYIIELS